MELRTFKLTLAIFSNFSNSTAGNETDALLSEGPYQTAEVVIIILAAVSLSLVTITGNILVILAIKINRNLQTINNYFIFSLACADLITGLSAMNLYTVYLVVGYWPLGPVVCDIWLILDYVVSAASVMNLLVISFDRYFCVTKPLSYPARRTTRMAFMMIAAAWAVAFTVWFPAILFPQFITGERIEEHECYVEFMSHSAFSCISSIICIYLPVAIMTFLYWRISRASKSRVKTGEQKLKEDKQSSNKVGNHITMPCGENVKTHRAERSQNGGTDGGTVEEKELSAPEHPERNEIAETPADYYGNPAHGLDGALSKQRLKKKTPPSRESKVTRLVMAILIAFVITWSPHHIMALINTICAPCIPDTAWTLSYWLCYINSTINPVCYAFCNGTFKKTFKQLLLCQHKDIRLGR